ncbi:MAG TPA: Xaa-Pro aminopeptidase [Candidatus Saccharimonadales bacterium]|nr:Xaa-Pro aminopeptidase [Candidatus Saccharimonadales bacterium]
METTLNAEFFQGNRERLRHLFTGTAPIVITANALLQQAADETYPFHQDRSFYYLTGIDEPGITLVMDKNKEYLIVPPRETVVEQFDGVIDFEELKRVSGVQQVKGEKEGWRLLSSRLKKAGHVATLGAAPRFVEYLGMYTNPARADLIQRMKDINPKVELLDLRTHLSRMRMVKQPVEIDLIQRAINITTSTMKEVLRPSKFTKYAHEYEIEADLSRGFRYQGGRGHAFYPVVSSGKNTCTMHYNKAKAALVSGELLLLDVGADYDYYAADVARTVSLGGNPSRRQKQVFDAVLDVQEYAFTLLKPGVVLQDYEKQVESYMGEKLRELGLIKTITSEAVRHYFPHRISHFLGLDTHDVGDYEHPIEPGVVITVEPGIYIPEEEIGVRIEDDVLITPEGNVNLSANLPRALC